MEEEKGNKESGVKHPETVLTITSEAVTTTSTILPFEDFIPLFRDIVECLDIAVGTYVKAQHNKNTCQLLVQKIGEANSQASILKTRKDLFTKENYSYLQTLSNTLDLIKDFIDEISTYSKLSKYLEGKSIEQTYKELYEEYNSSVKFLSSLVTVNSQISAQKESEMIKQDLSEFEKFKSVLTSSSNEEINQVVKDANETKLMMDDLLSNKKAFENQGLIDNFFQEKPLTFREYEQTDDEPRGGKLRKYIHIESKREYAFKVVATKKDSEKAKNQIKNQVIILKKLKGCLNIAHFYGLTYDENNVYLVTEWADNKNLEEYYRECKPDTKLKIRIAFDVVKGLNFLNAVGIVHHDIRPHNIVITALEKAKITNFELSRNTIDKTKNQELNVERARYNAPEILARGHGSERKFKKYDIKCEVYSFGILLWEIAEGKTPYKNYNDVLSIYELVCLKRHREIFSPSSELPVEYRDLSVKAVDQNPEERPDLTDILLEFNHIYNNFENLQPSTVIVVPSQHYDWSYTTLEEAVEEHKKAETDKEDADRNKLYECFDYFANLNNIQAKYYKAFYITKGWSNIDSESKRNEIAMALFEQAADFGDKFPDAQLRYGKMLINENNTEKGIQYLLKSANNGNTTAMFNVATWYHSRNNTVLGNRYMIMAAIKDYVPAIKYCTKNNIKYN